MALNKHLSLSEFIKNVHQQLRDDSKKIGSQEAWHKHCQNEKQLQHYAEAMQELALNYWDTNMLGKAKETSRIIWVCDMCLEYFWNDKLEYYRNKETDVAQKINIVLESSRVLNDYQHKKIRMLDVGSCYNPFGIYPEYFDVLPIDIAPANSHVLKCDFLNVTIDTYADKTLNEVLKLERNSFHVVVFSLLLEYLPTPELRLLCCQKAYELLMYEGLLIIITPDSKHVGANAVLMKSWQYVLATLGFSRIRYLKLQHIHCMAFRKCISSMTSERWATLYKSDNLYDKLYIPQDFNDKSYNVTCPKEKVSYELEHLPNFSDINDLL